MRTLYGYFYDEIVKLARNLVCGSCGCIYHDPSNFDLVLVTDPSLRKLRVDPSLVPFNFSSGIEDLDDHHIMIDPLGIVKTAGRPISVCICQSCQKSLKNDVQPPESLANFRWIGPVPPELQGLTWIEELLIARAHLNGTIVRLQNRNTTSHFGLKGHVILLPQDTTRLLDLLPFSAVVVTRYCSCCMDWKAGLVLDDFQFSCGPRLVSAKRPQGGPTPAIDHPGVPAGKRTFASSSTALTDCGGRIARLETLSLGDLPGNGTKSSGKVQAAVL